MNHHLLRFAKRATLRLIWSNFGFLFTVSLMPFTTAWLAETRLALVSMVVYAAVFVLMNVTYLFLEREGLSQGEVTGRLPRREMRRHARTRTLATLVGFGGAVFLSLRYSHGGFMVRVACCHT